MSEQESLHENTEPSNESTSLQQSSPEVPSQSSQSASSGRSNLRSRWKRKSSDPVSKPTASPEVKSSCGEVLNPSEIKETLSGREAFARPTVSNERTEEAPVMERPAVEEPRKFEARPSREHRKFERPHRTEERKPVEKSEAKESFSESKKPHERFEDYEPDASAAAAEDYTLDYSKQHATPEKKFQKSHSPYQSNKFGKSGSESSSSKFEKSERPERTGDQKERFQSTYARQHEKSHAHKKGVLSKIGGFFAAILGKKSDAKKPQSEERSWQKRSHREGGAGRSSEGGQGRPRHHGNKGGSGGGRSKGGYNRNSRGRGSIKG